MKRLKEIFTKFGDELLINSHYEFNTDELVLVFKNTNTGKKRLISLPNPKNTIYISKDKKMPKNYKVFEDIDNADKIYVNEKYKEWNIARELNMNSFGELVKKKEIKKDFVYLHKKLFAADINLPNNVLREYFKYHTKVNKDTNLLESKFPIVGDFHIGGLDIETDINVSDERAEQPVIVNTYVDGKTFTVYSRCLINEKYNGQKEIMDDLESFYKETTEFLKNHIESISFGGDTKKESEVKEMLLKCIDKINYKIKFTDDERRVINDINQIVFNNVNPDFLLIYNATYDINQMNMRLEALGENIEDSYRYKNTNGYYNFNTYNVNPTISKRFHNFDTHTPTKIIDQMLLYYQKRRANTYTKYSLDATANRELGVGKLDYSKLSNWIGDFPYEHYKEFLIYNIIDVLCMIFIDMITRDIYSSTYLRLSMCTEWQDLNKSMVQTSNSYDIIYEMNGKIPSCNRNPIFIDMTKKEIDKLCKSMPDLKNVIKQLKEVGESDRDTNPHRIMGGSVANPNTIDKSVKQNNIYNLHLRSFTRIPWVGDLDAEAMYPNDKIVNNSCMSTLIGRMIASNDFKIENYGRLASLAIINNNLANVGHYFFNLPSDEEIINDFYGLNPIHNTDENDYYIFDDIDINENLEPKLYKDIKSFYRKNYNTRYNDKDKEANSMSSNSLVFLSSSNKVEFTYYSSKVEVISSIPTIRSIDYGLKGFMCGSITKNHFKNLTKEYISKIKPMNQDLDLELVLSGVLEDSVIDDILNSKRLLYKLKFKKGYEYHLLDRSIFYHKSEFNSPLRYEIYDVKNEPKIFLIKFYHTYTTKNIKMDVVQSVGVLKSI